MLASKGLDAKEMLLMVDGTDFVKEAGGSLYFATSTSCRDMPLGCESASVNSANDAS